MPQQSSHSTPASAIDPSGRALRLRGTVDGIERWFALAAGKNLVGSRRDAAVHLADASVSRRHAVVLVEPTGVVVRDLGSKNGTFLNGRPIVDAPLVLGDELRCGPVRLVLEAIDPGDDALGLELSAVDAGPVGRDDTTLLSRHDGAPQRRHFALVDAVFERLADDAEPDETAALGLVAEALGAEGAALVEWRDEPVLLAAVGSVDQVPDRVWVDRGAQPPAEDWRLDDRWCGVVARHGDEPLGLLLHGEFPGRATAAPLLATLLRLVRHFRPPRLADTPAAEVETGARELEFPPGIVAGTAPAMRELYRQMTAIARGDLPVLLVGETGVGKEHLAQTLHRSSPRRDAPFMALNCAAIPAELLEAELFGIGRGVATGVQARRGKFLEASGGTLFLDEVGDMSPELQAKLLRALQERQIHPLGLAPVAIDVRVVAATNADLAARIEAGSFRADLYFRLAGVELQVPALRHRRRDLPRLIGHFLRRFAADAETSVRGLTVKALEQLVAYDWPGNVRQLEHEMRRVVYLCPPGQAIDSTMLSPTLRDGSNGVRAETTDGEDTQEAPRRGDGDGADLGDDLSLEPRLERLERTIIREALRRTAGNQTRAARLLGVSRNGLAYRLERLGLDAAEFAAG
ncbi:MAG: sigma 54-interacting transcriptional regulator [Acidobacteriota bacterium]